MLKQNKNFPLLLIKDDIYEFNPNNYSLNNNIVNENIFGFPLNDGTNEPSYLGKIVITDNVHECIDNLINKNTFGSNGEIASYINEQNIIDTSSNFITYSLKNENLYDVIKISQILSNTEVSNNIVSSLNDYDVLYDTDYSQYLYRAAKTYSISTNTVGELYIDNISGGNIIDRFIPIFSVASTVADLECELFIRNIPIPFKKWLSSIEGSTYHYIFIAPNYILKNYTQFLSSIQKIKFSESGTFILKYNYLVDNIKNEVTIKKHNLSTTANTFSDRAF